MELNYIKEHTSCVNYKTEEYSGFSLGQALTGENFDNQEQEIKANHLIFILSGEVEITKDENEKARVHANEFVFIPISSHYVGKVILPGRYINLTFFHNNISLCDKHMLSSYLKEESDVPLYFEALPIKEPLNLFLGLLETYLQAGVSCKHLHEIKERELFIIFRTTYTKREMIRLFHPIMGKEFDFKIAVLQHKDQVYSKKELAQLLGMSNSDLQRKFIQEFGKRLLNYILCIRFFIEVHSIVSASRFFHMPTYLRVVIECQSRFFPFFPAFSRNCPDYFLHTSGSSSFRSLSDLGAR